MYARDRLRRCTLSQANGKRAVATESERWFLIFMNGESSHEGKESEEERHTHTQPFNLNDCIPHSPSSPHATTRNCRKKLGRDYNASDRARMVGNC